MATAPIIPPAGPAGGGVPAAAPVPFIRNWGLSGWYVLTYVVIFALITLPVLLAAILNLIGMPWGNWYVLAVVTAAIDFPILFYPWPAIGMSIAEVIRRLRDKSPKDTVTMPRVYRIIVMSILATRLAIVVLAILPVARNGASIAVFLGLIGMVWIGNLIYSKSTWFVERVWNFYLLLLVGAVAYWVVVTIWPDLRHSAAKSKANETEQAILDQNEDWLKSEQKRIEGILLKMPANLAPAERVQRLTAADQVTWTKIQDASFTGKATDKLSSKLSGAGSAASGVIDWVKSKASSADRTTAAGQINNNAPATVTPAAAPKPTPAPVAAPAPAPVVSNVAWEGHYAPAVHKGPMSIGSFPETGSYKLLVTGLVPQTFYNDGKPFMGTIDSKGRVKDQGGECFVGYEPREGSFSPQFTGPGQCPGAVFVIVDKTKHWIADGACFSARAGEEGFVDLNRGNHPDHYRGDPTRGYQVRLIRC